jgi:hypothetical protein
MITNQPRIPRALTEIEAAVALGCATLSEARRRLNGLRPQFPTDDDGKTLWTDARLARILGERVPTDPREAENEAVRRAETARA